MQVSIIVLKFFSKFFFDYFYEKLFFENSYL